MEFPVAVCSGLLILLSQDFIIGAEVCRNNDIRVVGGPNEFEGRLEYCLNSEWGHICDNGMWDVTDGVVACRQLGHDPGSTDNNPLVFASLTQYYGAQEGRAHLHSIDCDGSESTLGDCRKEALINQTGCTNFNGYVYLTCRDLTCNGTTRDSARLVGGSSPAVGRLELCNTAKFRREVCDDGWDDNDARVVCRELGLLQPGVDPVALRGYQVISARVSAYTNVMCTGAESDFTYCNSEQTGPFHTCSYAGVNCSMSGTIPVPPLQGTTTDLMSSRTLITTGSLPSNSPTLNPSSLETTFAEKTISPLSVFSSSSPVPSQPPSSIPNSNDNSLLAAVIGAIGGVVVLLLVLILILFILILVKKRRTSQKFDESQQNNHIGIATIVPTVLQEPSIDTKERPVPRNRSASEYDRVLLNPLYKMRSRSNTASSNQVSHGDGDGYAEIKGITRKQSPLLQAKQYQPELDDGYSTPAVNGVQTQPGSHEYNTLMETDNTTSQPDVDEQGYAALDNHVYDDMQNITLPYTLEPNLATTVLSASPYETPMIPSYESSEIIKGLTITPGSGIGLSKSWNQANYEPTPDSNSTANHEYSLLEENNGTGGREYESPIITVNGGSMELHTIPEYESLDPH